MAKRPRRRTVTHSEPVVAPISPLEARSPDAVQRGLRETEAVIATFEGLKRMWGTPKILTRRAWEEIKRLEGTAD